MKRSKRMLLRPVMTSALCLSLLCLMAGSLLAQDMAAAREALRNVEGTSRYSDTRMMQQGMLRRDAVDPLYQDPNDPNEATDPDVIRVQEARSDLEKYMAGETPDPNEIKELTQFGYNVFNGRKTRFDPVRNVPVGPDYTVGPGDSLTVTMWGLQNERFSVAVERDGNITLPEVGVLSVSGMPFGTLQDYLESELKRKLPNVRMHVSMGRLRTITVYVTGEAIVPGTQTLSSLATVINALFAAGGPTKNGSLRNIKVMRLGQEPQTLDLYDFLMGGDSSIDIRLRDGDTIHIPIIGDVVGVAGNVKRPAIYEMKGPMTLSAALDLSGGVSYAGWLQRIQIERVQNHQRRIVADFDLSQPLTKNQEPASNNQLATPIQDGDIIIVESVLELEHNVVFLKGHVERESKYGLFEGMRISDVLTSYELFKPQVNLEHAEIKRLLPPDLHPIIIPFNLGKVLKGDEAENHVLQQFDTIRLFKWDERGKSSVFIEGMVYDPNEYQFVDGMRVKDLINAAGGVQKDAYLKSAELMRYYVSQTGVVSEKIEFHLEHALAGDVVDNLQLQDHDHLVIRPIPELEFDRTIEVSGEVKFPGVYPIHKGERLKSVLERAGGYAQEAYLKGAVFTRTSAKEIQQKRMDDMMSRLEETLLTQSSQSASGAMDSEAVSMQQAEVEAQQVLLDKLRTLEPDGRVVVRLMPLEQLTGSKYDMILEDGDTLDIPKTPGIVNVVGEVFNPTSLLYEEGQSLRYYLSKVGGVRKEADKKQLTVIRADGTVVSIAQKGNNRITWDKETRSWYSGGFMSLRLAPGDTLVVPTKMDRVPWMKYTKDLTQILFQIAVSAGVVLAL
ncbi:MAG: SLBB domain-containing protein [Phycisphaeraceae bacterium]|nr:SLBB domain-containing protein [Phycisphaeraceae bacterium]